MNSIIRMAGEALLERTFPNQLVPETLTKNNRVEKVEISLLHETVILRLDGFGNGGA